MSDNRHPPIYKDITRGAKLAFAVAFVLILIVCTANLIAYFGEFQAFRAQYNQIQAEQRQQGQQTEQRLCATLGQLAALKPPAGDAATNPGRGYDQQLHDVLAALGSDINCPGK